MSKINLLCLFFLPILLYFGCRNSEKENSSRNYEDHQNHLVQAQSTKGEKVIVDI
jgi:hypothetical protein